MKEGSRRKALDEIMKKSFFRHARSKDNIVRFENDEITTWNLNCKDKSLS